jgi:hypothetical protein
MSGLQIGKGCQPGDSPSLWPEEVPKDSSFPIAPGNDSYGVTPCAQWYRKPIAFLVGQFPLPFHFFFAFFLRKSHAAFIKPAFWGLSRAIGLILFMWWFVFVVKNLFQTTTCFGVIGSLLYLKTKTLRVLRRPC